MNSLVLLIGAVIVFFGAYVMYGGWLVKKWGIDETRETPAKTKFDNVDYVPTDAKVLLGHHFSSIAGAGPITGPILAAVFGWLPAFLWIMFGSIFIGGVHDFGALFASIRHEGKSIGEIISANIGRRGKLLFNFFAYATLILVVAAFTSICSGTFAYSEETGSLVGAQAGTASVLFIILAVVFGFMVYRKSAKLGVATVVGVILLFTCIFVGYKCPVLKLSQNTWNIVLILYIACASVLPVWILLQPRDYLCSFLLYAMLAGGIIGILLTNPHMVLNSFNGFVDGSGNHLFPFLFITIACGAISGFHSLVSSGTTAKQIDNEKNARLIGYGSMLIEGILAVIALITVSYKADLVGSGTPTQIFAAGLSTFMNSFGLPVEVGQVFVTLAFSAFALTSLDTATRIGRYIFQEIFDDASEPVKKFFGNSIVATLITVVLSALLIGYGYQNIWPVFGAANQLLGALALLALTSWLANNHKNSLMTGIPMFFMFAVTVTALLLLIKQHLFGATPNYILAVIAIILFVLAIWIIIEAIMKLAKRTDTSNSVTK